MTSTQYTLFMVTLALLSAKAMAQPDFDKLQTKEELYNAEMATKSLATLASSMTRDCPLRNTANTWIDSVTFHTDGGTLKYYLRIDPDAMSEREFYIMEYVQREELEKKLIASFIPDTNMLKIFQLLDMLDGTMQWEYRREKEHFTVSITPSEVNDARHTQVSESTVAYRKLMEFVTQTNRQLPHPIAEELTLDSLTLDSLFLSYHYSASSARYNMDLLASSGRDKMLKSLKEATGGSLQQLTLMRTALLGFQVVYHDITPSGKHAEYIIAHEELKRM